MTMIYDDGVRDATSPRSREDGARDSHIPCPPRARAPHLGRLLLLELVGELLLRLEVVDRDLQLGVALGELEVLRGERLKHGLVRVALVDNL